MTQLEKRVDDTSYTVATQQRRFSRVGGVCSFNRKVQIVIQLAVFASFLSVASGKPTNPCNTETQFWVENDNGSVSCENCPSCPPGQSLSLECGQRIRSSAMLSCKPCPPGVSFSNSHGTSSCSPCSSCAEGQVVLQNCTPEWDIKCEKRCYSKERYYDDDKGDCFPCSKCCHDDQDVVKDECKEKLGAESHIICSFDSSVNRCDKSTPSPSKPTTIKNHSTTIINYPSPSQGSEHNLDTVPHTGLTRRHLSTTTTTTTTTAAKGQDLLILVGVPVGAVLALVLMFAGCLYICKTRKICNLPWCSYDTETDIPDSVNNASQSCVVLYKPAKNSDLVTVVKSDKVGACTHDKISITESLTPLLEEGNQESLACSCQQDSKLLKSLLDCENDLGEISEHLDTTMAGVGTYRAVAQHYDIGYCKISSVLEKQDRGPSTALIQYLAATKPELTVQEFAAVVREKAKREDVVKLLVAYDSKRETENAFNLEP